MTRQKETLPQRYLQLAVIIVSGALLAVSVAAVFSWVKTDPVQAMARNTARLLDTTERLEASLSSTSPTNKVTRRYLAYLSDIKKVCSEIQALSRNSELARDATAKSIARSSTALCKDLLVIAEDSERLYRPAQTLLSIDTKVKRYQTIPFITKQLRQNHASIISTAARELSGTSEHSNGYPFSATHLVKQVQQNQINSSKLTYLPALHRAQVQLLAERQQYWTAYGGIADLNRELKVQMTRYCRLPELDNDPTLCKDSAE